VASESYQGCAGQRDTMPAQDRSRFALERFPSISHRIVTGHPRSLTLPFSRGAGITRLLSLLGSLLAAGFCFRSRNESFFGKAQRDTATLPRTMAEFSYRSRAIVARDPEKTQATSTWELRTRSDNRPCTQEALVRNRETSRAASQRGEGEASVNPPFYRRHSASGG